VLRYFGAPTLTVRRSLPRFVPLVARVDVLSDLLPLRLEDMTPSSTSTSTTTTSTAPTAVADPLLAVLAAESDAPLSMQRSPAHSRRHSPATSVVSSSNNNNNNSTVTESAGSAPGSPMAARRGSPSGVVLGRGRQIVTADRAVPFETLLVERLEVQSVAEHAAFVDELHARRASLLRLSQPAYRWVDPEDYLCRRKRTEMWRDPPIERIEITVGYFGVAIGEYEPLFCRMALYDLRSHKKLTEDFHFDFNTDAVRFFMGDQSEVDAATTARTAVFSLFELHADIYVVISVEKVLQGPDEQVHKPYVEIEGQKFKKNFVKYTDRMKDACNTFSKYRQHFCIAAVPLFSAPGQFSFTKGAPIKEFYTAAALDLESMWDFIAASAPNSTAKKFKRGRVLPGLCELSARHIKAADMHNDERWSNASRLDASDNVLSNSPLPYEIVGVADGDDVVDLSASDKQLKRKASKTKAAAAAAAAAADPSDQWGISAAPSVEAVITSNDVIKMTLPLETRPSLKPHWRYQDLLFIYPQSLSARKLYGRNIVVSVRMRADDNNLEDASADETCFFGRSSGARMKRVAYSRVTWHAKQLVFQDEIKVQLPLTLSAKHHLLFTVIELDEKKKGTPELETVVGWAFYNLLEHDGSVRSPHLSLVVVEGAPPTEHYLNPESFTALKYYEQEKPCFGATLAYHSTVRTFDAPLARFLSLPPRGGSDNIKRTVEVLESLSRAEPLECVRFFPVVASSLVALICSANETLSMTAFRALVRVFVGVARHTAASSNEAVERDRSAFLTNWIDHLLELPRGADIALSLHDSLLTDLLMFFVEQQALSKSGTGADAGGVEMLRYLWVVLDMVLKSITLTLDAKALLKSNGASGDGGERGKRVPETFFDLLAKLLTTMIQFGLERLDVLPFSVLRQANAYISLFLRELLLLLDRGAVLAVATAYLDKIVISPADHEMRQASKAYLRVEFLQVFCDTELHMQLLLPSVAALPLDADGAALAHPLAGVLCRSVLLTLRQLRSHPARHSAITVLSEQVNKLLNDERFKDEAVHEHVATSYFVLVLLICEQWRELAEWRAQATSLERRSLYEVAMHVLATLPRPLLIEWIDRASTARLLALGELCADCVDAFAVTPADRAAAPLGVHLSLQLLLDSLPLRGGDERQALSLLSSATTLQHGEFGGAGEGELSPRRISLSGSAARRESENAAEAASATMVASSSPRSSLSASSSSTSAASRTTDDLPSTPERPGSSSKRSAPNTASTLRPRRAAPTVEVTSASASSSGSAVDGQRRRRAAGGSGSGSGGEGVLSRRRGGPDSPKPRQRSDSWSTSHKPTSAEDFGGDDAGDTTPVKGTVPADQRSVQIARNLSFQAYLCVLELAERLLERRGRLDDGDVTKRARRRNAASADDVSAVALFAYRLQLKMSEKSIPQTLAMPLFAALEYFLATHAPLFFGGEDASVCQDWCTAFVRYLSGFTSTLRQEAACALFLLLRDDQRFNGQLGRAGTQTTMAMSKFASSPAFASANKLDLHQCLLTLSSYSMHMFALPETTLEPSVRVRADELERAALVAKADFAHRVHGLQSTLVGILSDTSKLLHMRATSDAESIQELMWQIARGYSNTPDLRHAWLDMLAEEHAARGNWAEAGVCAVNAALLVSLHLRARDGDAAPVQIDVLRSIAVGTTEALPAHGGRDACTTAAFTVDGLATTLKRAINYMTQADCFEFAVQLTKALLPIYEQRRQYQALALMHKNNAGLLKQIVDLSIQRSRHLGRYFRVGLYGSKFGALSGTEFIYKEPKLTHLFAFADRLKEAFARRFEIDADDINIVKDSKRVSSIDHEKCSVQLTLVKPYFDTDELAQRKGYFELRTHVRRFVFLTPFTKDPGGKNYGGVDQQWVRQTVLTTETTFPGLLKRYRVIATHEFEQTPLDVGLELIRKRNQLLTEELDLSPPNIKSLQSALQGSVLLQVNEGPIEVCRVFLGSHADQTYPLATLRQLDGAMRLFLELCQSALVRNEGLIGPDQQAFHAELVQGYARTAAQVRDYLLPEAMLTEEETTTVVSSGLADDSPDSSSLRTSATSVERPRSRAPSPVRVRSEPRGSALAVHSSVDDLTMEDAADNSNDSDGGDVAAAAAALSSSSKKKKVRRAKKDTNE
jgi:hypothetical protein